MWFRSSFASRSPHHPRPNVQRRRSGERRRREVRQLLVEGLEARSLMAFDVLAEYATGAYPVDVVLTDLNADGRPDMIVANSGSASLDVRFNNGDGTFGAAASLALNGAPGSLAVGDFDGDGTPDIATAVSNYSESHLSILTGNGDGTFQPPVDLSIPPQDIIGPGFSVTQPQLLGSVAVGDLNDDGKLDLVVKGGNAFTNCPWYCYGTYGDTYVNVLLGDGSGGFGEPAVHPLGTGANYYSPVPGDVAIEDLNGDSHDDVITEGIWSGLTFLAGDGTGQLGSPVNSGSGSPLSSLSLVDIDGDGLTDTVLKSGSSLLVQKGQGDGTFSSTTSVDLELYLDSAVVGDVNGDGKIDLVAVSSPHTCTDAYYYCYSGYTSKLATVVLGTGAGSFAAPATSTWGTIDGTYDSAWYSDLALADLTGDGLPDLAALEANGGTAVIAKGSWPPADAPFLNIDSVTVVEGDAGTQQVTLTASLSAAYSQTVTADFFTTNGSAWAGDDYESSAGSLTFAPGDTTTSITLNINGDRVIESDESFSVRLANLVNANAGSKGTVTILDNEPHLSIDHPYGIDPLTVVEGDTGTTPAVFTVTLAMAYDQEVTVDYYTLTGHTSDIVSTSGTLHFAPGVTSQTITVQVVGDLIDEDVEAFNVYLTNPSSNATIVNGGAYCNIEDNDPSPSITISDVSKNEGNKGTTSFVFTISLSAPSSRSITVDFATVNGTATTADNDYDGASGTVTIPAGATTGTIKILVRGDKKKEANETFYVNLTGASNATISDNQALGTIVNDDNAGGGGKGRNAPADTVADVLAASSLKTRKRR